MKIKKILTAVISTAVSASMLFTMNASASILYPDTYTDETYDGYFWFIAELEGDPVSRYEGAQKMGVHDFVLTDEGKAAYETVMQEHKEVMDEITDLIGTAPDLMYDYTAATNGVLIALNNEQANIVEQNKDKLGIKRFICSYYAYRGNYKKAYEKEDEEKQEPDYSLLTRRIAELTGSSDIGEKGEGMLIAVVDSEFDTSHEYFSLSDGVQKKLTTEGIKQMQPFLISGKYVSDKCFVSDKIPFAFNYAKKSYETFVAYNEAVSHGTHVAGIAAGNGQGVSGENKKYALDGAAPEAQLILLSISNDGNSLPDQAIFAAYDDALYLGADVINASYGATGMSYNTSEEVETLGYEAVSNISNTGTVFCCAAGNEERMKLGEHTDYSVGGSPALERDILTVASADNPVCEENKIITGSGEEIYSLPAVISAAEAFDGQTLEYVMLPDDCQDDYFDDVDVDGKILIMNSGKVKISEDVMADAGAVGLLTACTKGKMLYQAARKILPGCTISYEDGLKLQKSTKKTLTFSKETYIVATDDLKINDYSSWCFSEGLDLKPDIAGFGGNILSSGSDVSDNHRYYMSISGTSMATPNVTGLSALLLQHIKSEPEKYGITSRKELAELTAKLFMSTAQPIFYDNTMQTASPRVQGNGLANVKNAIETPCYISTNSERDNFRPKLSLGDGYKDKYTLEFNITNVSGKACGYSPELTLFRDEFDQDGQVCNTHQDFKKGTDFNVVYRDDTGAETKRFVVKKGETKTFTAEVTLSEEAFGKIKEDGGAFVDGYLRFKNKDLPTLTLAFTAFDGEYGKPSENGLFMKFINSEDEYVNGLEDDDAKDEAFYDHSIIYDGYYRLGYNSIDHSISDTVYVSPNEDGLMDKIRLVLKFNRRCYDLKAEVTNKKGEVVYTQNYGNIDMFTNDVESPVIKYINVDYDFKENGKVINNAEYTLTVSAIAPLGNERYSVSQKVVVDTQAPKIKKVGLLKAEYDEFYVIEATDNCCLTGAVTDQDDFYMANIKDSKLGKYMIVRKKIDESSYDDGKNDEIASDIGEYADSLEFVDYAEVYDMAGNYAEITDDDVSYTLTINADGRIAYATEEDEDYTVLYTILNEKGKPSSLELSWEPNVDPEDPDKTEFDGMDIFVDGFYIDTIAAIKGIAGDANGDGKCDVRDAALIAKKLAGSEEEMEEFMNSDYSYFADYNRDGKIDVRDAAAIARKLASKSAEALQEEAA